MTDDDPDPFADIDVESATAADVDVADVRAAVAHEDPSVQRAAVAVGTSIAAEDIEALDPYVDALAPLLAADNPATALRAGGLLSRAAAEYPTAFSDHVPEILALLESDLGGHRSLGADMLAAVVVENAGACTAHFDRIVETLAATDVDVTTDLSEGDHSMDAVEQEAVHQTEGEEEQLRIGARSTLANVVVAIVEDHPNAVADDVADVAGLADHPDDVVVGCAVDALRAYAEHDPSLLAGHTDGLVALLDHDDRIVRARAVRALGFAEAEGAIEDLRRVADDDPDEDVRELAAETADFLESA